MADMKDDVLNLTYGAGRKVGVFFRQHHKKVLWAAVLIALAITVVRGLTDLSSRKVILYTGTAGSDSYRHGQTIRDYFEQHTYLGLMSYDIEFRPSEGLDDNRRRVATADNGAMILGFDQDGFQPPQTVRTMLPLTDVTLHVLIRHTPSRWTEPATVQCALATTLQEYLRALKMTPATATPRCYLGPKGSGTRLLAEHILKHYGVSKQDADVGAFIDWDAAYRMLRRGELDILFDAAEIGSPYMVEVAGEKNYRLLSLDHVEGIVQGYPGLMLKKIPRGVYPLNTDFCAHDAVTVSTQRVIICPAHLTTFDGYYLTRGIREALRASIPKIAWDKKEPTPGAERVIPLHEGAKQLYDDAPAPWIVFVGGLQRHWVQWILPGLAFIWTLWTYLRNRRRATEPPTAPPMPPSEAPSAPPSGPPTNPIPSSTPAPPVTPVATVLPWELRVLQADLDDVARRLPVCEQSNKSELQKLRTKLRNIRKELMSECRDWDAEHSAAVNELLARLTRLEFSCEAMKPTPPTPSPSPDETHGAD